MRIFGYRPELVTTVPDDLSLSLSDFTSTPLVETQTELNWVGLRSHQASSITYERAFFGFSEKSLTAIPDNAPSLLISRHEGAFLSRLNSSHSQIYSQGGGLRDIARSVGVWRYRVCRIITRLLKRSGDGGCKWRRHPLPKVRGSRSRR